jgi:DNA invertase Pin-like site-specific DNA recombinase
MKIGYDRLTEPPKHTTEAFRDRIIEQLSRFEPSDPVWDAIMKTGYARVSSRDQKLAVQATQLTAAGCDTIYQEKESTRNNRPELDRALEHLRAGDVLIVTKLDRLARSTRELLAIADRIQRAGATFRSLGEPWADTTTHAGKFIMTVFAGIAEFERERTRERCAEGITSARKNGTRFGRPPALDKEQRNLALRLWKEGKSTGQIGRTFDVSSETIRRLIQTKRARGQNGSKGA